MSRVVVSIMEEKAQAYWRASRQWRGNQQYGSITIGELLTAAADLAGDLNQLGWRRAEGLAASLLRQVTDNKRNRKRKPINNVVNLLERKAVQSRVLLDMLRAHEPEGIIGKSVILNITTKAG